MKKKIKELDCGCIENTCSCDVNKHWPPVACKECPQLKKFAEVLKK